MAERFFSIVKRLFGDQQVSAYLDMVEMAARASMANTELEKVLKELKEAAGEGE